MAEGPYWGWSILGGGGLLDSNLGAVSTSMGLTSPAPGATASSAGGIPNPVAGSGGKSGATTQSYNSSPPPLPNPGGTDSNGVTHADPHWTPQEQAQYEAAANSGDWETAKAINDAAWKNYDTRRAQAGSIARSWAAVGQNSGPTASGLDYDPKTGKWKYYDTKTKGWAEGNSIDDIYNTIFNEKQKAEHPLSYYQNLQQSQDQGERSRIQSNYRQSQSDALMSTPTTRYQPVNF